jgi:hypothetical protein
MVAFLSLWCRHAPHGGGVVAPFYHSGRPVSNRGDTAGGSDGQRFRETFTSKSDGIQFSSPSV